MDGKQRPRGNEPSRSDARRRRAGENQRQRLAYLRRVTRTGVLAASIALSVAFAGLAARHSEASNTVAGADTAGDAAALDDATPTPSGSLFSGQGNGSGITATPTPKGAAKPKPLVKPTPTPRPRARVKHHSHSGSS